VVLFVSSGSIGVKANLAVLEKTKALAQGYPDLPNSPIDGSEDLQTERRMD
jgi:hypothetical protein